MQPRTHMWITQQVTGSSDPYLLLGSVIPDFQIDGNLPRGFDQQVIELLRFLKANYPDLINIGIGMCLHEYPIGVDRFVHTQYRDGPGYAFSFVDRLLDDARAATPLQERMLPLFTHFVIEDVIEYKIIHEHPEMAGVYTNVFASVDKRRVCKALAEFYRVPQERVENEWDIYVTAIGQYGWNSYEGVAKGWLWFLERLFHDTADYREIAKIMRKAERLIEPTVDIFLMESIAQCKEDFRYNFPSFKEK